MKKRAGKMWAWFDSAAKRIAAGAVALSILTGAVVTVDGRFGKSWEVAEIRYRLDKRDLLEIKRQIADLEATQRTRRLTPAEHEWLRQLLELQSETVQQLQEQRK